MSFVSYLLGCGSALLVGFSKTGLPGVSIPGILLMAEAFPDNALLSLGAILPVLLAGDIFAVAWYRHHAQWSRLLGLFPFVALGMVPGVVVLQMIEGNQLRPVLGELVLGLLAIEAGRRWREMRRRRARASSLGEEALRQDERTAYPRLPLGNGEAADNGRSPLPVSSAVSSVFGSQAAAEPEDAAVQLLVEPAGEPPPRVALPLLTVPGPACCKEAFRPLPPEQCCCDLQTEQDAQVAPRLFSTAWWFMASMGVLAGFATMIANAAMPVMTIYFLSRGLLKKEFIGTAAWFFFLVNLSKLPICYRLGVITPRTLQFGLAVMPVTVVGALVGVYVLARIPQRFFDALALALAGIAAVRLIVV